MRLNAEVGKEDMIESILMLNHDEIMDLLVRIDAEVQDFEFTEQLARTLVKALYECALPEQPFDVMSLKP